jgi:crotonobetainyl-CoA:carnitine CoA-transferase CaiB-like acyl-CoA transferase
VRWRLQHADHVPQHEGDRTLDRSPRTNLLDGGAPFYRTYECKDGGFMAIGALEPQFYAELRQLAGLSEDCYDRQMDKAGWPNLHEKMTALFKTKTRDEWSALLEGSDAAPPPCAGCSMHRTIRISLRARLSSMSMAMCGRRPRRDFRARRPAFKALRRCRRSMPPTFFRSGRSQKRQKPPDVITT